MPTVLHPDPFNAVLLASPALVVTDEQSKVIRRILETACSDNQFADKAFKAITRVLTSVPVVPPVVSSLTPNSAEIGDPNFILHVHGTGFKTGSIIVFAGQEEPTTFVSPTEITTGVNMSVWLGPDALPVHVLNPDGIQSDPMTFTFTDGSLVAQSGLVGIPKQASIVTTTKK